MKLRKYSSDNSLQPSFEIYLSSLSLNLYTQIIIYNGPKTKFLIFHHILKTIRNHLLNTGSRYQNFKILKSNQKPQIQVDFCIQNYTQKSSHFLFEIDHKKPFHHLLQHGELYQIELSHSMWQVTQRKRIYGLCFLSHDGPYQTITPLTLTAKSATNLEEQMEGPFQTLYLFQKSYPPQIYQPFLNRPHTSSTSHSQKSKCL